MSAVEAGAQPPTDGTAESQAEARLFSEGLAGPHVDAYRARVRALLRDRIVPLIEVAERERSFPREAIHRLGAAGLFRERWAGGPPGDLGKSVLLAEELGRAGLGGIGVGVSLHLEAALGILMGFGRSPWAGACAQGALSGRLVACLATSERDVGSELTGVATTLERDGEAWRVRGRKWFVSPGAAADFALILCRLDGVRGGDRSRTAPLALVVVPRRAYHVESKLSTTGVRGLETVRIRLDTRVADHALVGRPGTALLAVLWGLTHERLALAAQALGAAELALGLTLARLRRRRQFGVALFEHQALRLRVADLSAQVALARDGTYAAAATFPRSSSERARKAAGIKATATRLAEHVIGECLHVFGGTGYLEDETPMARLWRDVRIGRLGAGSDEMMWELVAAGLEGDDEAYDRMVATEP